MKEIDELHLPDSVRYTEDHEYVMHEGSEEGTVKIGINDYAQDQLGDIVFVELPEEGDRFDKGDAFGTVESVKAVAELYIPISGEVVAINSVLEDLPELVNTSPYGEGWMIRVKPRDLGEIDMLMTRDAYMEMLGEVA